MTKPNLLLLLLTALLMPTNASAETWGALLSDLLGYLNMDSAQLRRQLHDGEIIYAGMPEHEILPEQLAVGGTLMLLKRQPAAHVVRAFVDVEKMVKHAGSDVIGLVTADDPSIFFDLDLPRADLQAFGAANASAIFNLSVREAGQLRSRSKISKEDYGELLRGRFQRYYDRGLPGLEPYVRPKRKDDPARELLAAFDGFDFLNEHFPNFHSTILSEPRGQPHTGEQLFVLHETESNGKTVHVLSRQLFEVSDTWGLGADLQFYATHGLNAGFVLMGVVPYQQGSLVFALFHMFTNEVLGIGTTLKKRIGRGRATEILTDHFRTVRLQLEQAGSAAAVETARR